MSKSKPFVAKMRAGLYAVDQYTVAYKLKTNTWWVLDCKVRDYMNGNQNHKLIREFDTKKQAVKWLGA